MLNKNNAVSGMLHEMARRVESGEIDPFDAIDMLSRFADKVHTFNGDIDSEVVRVLKMIQNETLDNRIRRIADEVHVKAEHRAMRARRIMS